MENRHIDEICRIESEAMQQLRHGTERPQMARRIQALVLPSFEDCCAYELMLPVPPISIEVRGRRPVPASPDISSALAVRTIWKKREDLEKFRTPVTRLGYGVSVRLHPTIEVTEVALTMAPVEALLSRAGALTIPPYIPNPESGLDGTSYELVFGHSFVQARLQWWCDAPPGWEPLALLLKEIETLVESTIASR